MSLRSLFALDLNIGLLSTNLKIGICAGIAGVAVCSGIFTIVVHIEDLKSKSSIISLIGEGFKYALGETFKPTVRGYEALYKEIKEKVDEVIKKPEVLYSWAHVDDLDFWKKGIKSLLLGVSDIKEEVAKIGNKLKKITESNIGEEAAKLDHFKNGVTPKGLYTYAVTKLFWCNFKQDNSNAQSGQSQNQKCQQDETNIQKIHADIVSYFREHLFGEKPPGSAPAAAAAKA